jgi:hypothetical protein
MGLLDAQQSRPACWNMVRLLQRPWATSMGEQEEQEEQEPITARA